VKSGEGCAGFSYSFVYDKQLNEAEDYVLQLKDSVIFALDAETLRFCKGSIIDYEQEIVRSTFYVRSRWLASLKGQREPQLSEELQLQNFLLAERQAVRVRLESNHSSRMQQVR